MNEYVPIQFQYGNAKSLLIDILKYKKKKKKEICQRPRGKKICVTAFSTSYFFSCLETNLNVNLKHFKLLDLFFAEIVTSL